MRGARAAKGLWRTSDQSFSSASIITMLLPRTTCTRIAHALHTHCTRVAHALRMHCMHCACTAHVLLPRAHCMLRHGTAAGAWVWGAPPPTLVAR